MDGAPRKPGLTNEQSLAVTTRAVSVLLSSGAGCGKTHVLTERYLAHLREGAEVGQIVAITFTERAARQMRARIRQRILDHLRGASEEEADTWARHLRNLETAPISTIHSFCGTLLRQNCVEAGLDPRFDVLEDVLSVNLGSEAFGSALQRLLTAHTIPGEDLRQLVLLFGWRGVNQAVPPLAESHDLAGWTAWLETPSEDIAAAWHDFALNELRPRYLDYILAARPRIANLMPLLRRHPPVPGPLSENVQLLLDELPRLPAAINLADAVERLAEAAKVGGKGAKAWPDEVVYAQVKEAFEEFRADIRALKLDRFDLDPRELLPAIEVGKRYLRVAAEAWHSYRERKQFYSVVDFQDLLVLARDLLRDHPAVRTRLQERFQFLLIDELQDTDPVQMDLVRHLCGAKLTEGKLFAVGDSSQSIYRFRKADVSLFQGLRTQMHHDGRQGLTLNFRSQPTILDFTNALLGHRLADYQPLRPHHDQVNPEACIEFLWSARGEGSDASAGREAEAEGIARRLAAMVGREKLVAEKGKHAGRLREVRRGDIVLLFRAMSNVHLYEAALRQQGLEYYLVGGRAFFAQQEIYDLLNLLRTLENPQDEVSLAGTLRSPFCCLSDEAIFVLRFAPLSPLAPVGGREGVRGKQEGSPTNEPEERRTLTRRPLWEGLHDDTTLERLPADQWPRVLRARQFLARWRSLKDRVSIARLLGEVFADSGYDAAMQFEFLGERKLANLWKLVELARTFDRSGLFGLAEFIGRLGELVESQPREEQAATQPENADVIRLMTIHQAKGLEFPVVVIPDMNSAVGSTHLAGAHWDPRLGCLVRPPSEEPPPFGDHGWSLWRMREDIEDWNESLRTLYVACTRAEDYLILSAGLSSALEPSNPWMQTLASRFDLRTGECLAAVEHVPEVRVTGSVVGVEFTATPITPPEEEADSEESGWPEPVPIRGGAQTVFSVEELEATLADPSAVRVTWAEGAFTPQHDAEDGSDLNDWTARPDMENVRERVLHTLLKLGGLDDPSSTLLKFGGLDGASSWQAALRKIAGRLGLPAADTGELEAGLARFIEQFPWLWKMDARWFEREFLLEWPRKRPPRGLRHRPVVRGTIDILWRHGKQWGVIWLSSAKVAELRPGLVFWVHAAREWFGGWPKQVDAHSLADGTTLTEEGSWSGSELIARFHDALGKRAEEGTA